MNQVKNIRLIKGILKKKFNSLHYRIIKIHGSKYQESGLPDIKLEIEGFHFWIEIKRDWEDDPTPIQLYNVRDLRKFGYITGFIAGDEFKKNWDDKTPIKFINLLISHKKIKKKYN